MTRYHCHFPPANRRRRARRHPPPAGSLRRAHRHPPPAGCLHLQPEARLDQMEWPCVSVNV